MFGDFFSDAFSSLSDFVSETVSNLVTIKIDTPDGTSTTITVDDDSSKGDSNDWDDLWF